MITVQLPKGSVSRSGDHNTQESNIGEENPPKPAPDTWGERAPCRGKAGSSVAVQAVTKGCTGDRGGEGALTARSNLGEKRE